jgi:hypothetical protein
MRKSLSQRLSREEMAELADFAEGDIGWKRSRTPKRRRKLKFGNRKWEEAGFTMRIPGLLIFVLFTAGTCAGQQIPGVKTKALDDSEVVLPKAGSRQVLVLVVGFSKKGGDVCGVWSRQIAAEYGGDAGVAYYSLPMLEEAPSFLRPMIEHGMKNGATAKELAHMAPVTAGEQQWKKVVGYAAADDAYLVVADAQGKLVWQGHGAYSDAALGELKKAVASARTKIETRK